MVVVVEVWVVVLLLGIIMGEEEIIILMTIIAVLEWVVVATTIFPINTFAPILVTMATTVLVGIVMVVVLVVEAEEEEEGGGVAAVVVEGMILVSMEKEEVGVLLLQRWEADWAVLGALVVVVLVACWNRRDLSCPLEEEESLEEIRHPLHRDIVAYRRRHQAATTT